MRGLHKGAAAMTAISARDISARHQGYNAQSQCTLFNYRPRLRGRQLNSTGVFDKYALGRTSPAGLIMRSHAGLIIRH